MLVLLDFCKFAPKCISDTECVHPNLLENMDLEIIVVVVNCKSGVFIKMAVSFLLRIL